MPYPYNGFNSNPYLTPQMPVVPQMPYGQPNSQPIANNGYQPQMNAPQPQATVNSPNKIYVTNLQDALSRFSSPNMTISYTTQDEKYEIEVFTDGQGKKTYQVFERKPYTPEEKPAMEQQPTANFATKDDVASIEKMLNDKLAEFSRSIADVKASIKTVSVPDLGNYATLSDIDGLRDDLTSSLKAEINGLKTKISSLGVKKNAE